MSDEKYALVCALTGLLNATELTNVQVIDATGLDMSAQAFSRHVHGKNGPSDRVVHAILEAARSRPGFDDTVIGRDFPALRRFLDDTTVVLHRETPEQKARKVLIHRTMPALAQAEEYWAVAMLGEAFGNRDNEIADIMTQIAAWDAEACAALLVAFTRVHGDDRAATVRELITEQDSPLDSDLRAREDELTEIALAGEAAMARRGETAMKARTRNALPGAHDHQAVARVAALVRHGRMSEALRAWWRWDSAEPALSPSANLARVLRAIMLIEWDGSLMAAGLVDAAIGKDLETTAEAVLADWLPNNIIPESEEYRRFLRGVRPETFLCLATSLLKWQKLDRTHPDRPIRDTVDPAAFFRAADHQQVVWLIRQYHSVKTLDAELARYIDVERAVRTLATGSLEDAAAFVARVLHGLCLRQALPAQTSSSHAPPQDQHFICGVARALCADYLLIAAVLGRATGKCHNVSAELLWHRLLGATSAEDPSLGLIGMILDLNGSRPIAGLSVGKPTWDGALAPSLPDCFAALLWRLEDRGPLVSRAVHVCPMFTAYALVALLRYNIPVQASAQLVIRHTSDAMRLDAVTVLEHMSAICSRFSLQAVQHQARVLARAAECLRDGHRANAMMMLEVPVLELSSGPGQF
ncbi:hypothetical protein [Nocardia sp. NPDC050435]|uniref:hypothetical protein n=1 Tax=Nocardia sp. NPDC050435 TaxID=3155040 RepID=UPI0033FF0A64